MKVLLYSEGKKAFSKSGVGRALKHQMKALNYAGVKYTVNVNDNIDVVHINTIGLSAERIMKKAKKSGIPVVYHTHTTFEDFRNSFFFSNLMAPYIKRRLTKLYSMADYLISPSQYTRNIVESYGVKTPGKVISNGVDTFRFKKNDDFAKRFKKEFEINGPVIISVGLPFKRKGVHDFCEIAKKLPEYTFIWFGAKITSLLPREVKNLIKNPPKNVKFPGYVSDETILGAYSSADAFFFPSYEENEGIVVLEALSMKCPVILRDIPVYKEWMQNGFNCLKGKDNNEFANLITSIVQGENKAKEITENGRKTAEERELHLIGEQLKAVYEEVLLKNKG